jgi:hypothetical protein
MEIGNSGAFTSAPVGTRSVPLSLLLEGLLGEAVATFVATRKVTTASAVPAYAITLSLS